jgi:hypothetical protein
MSDTTTGRKRKGRSPNYPGIDLQQALERAKTIWDKEQHHAVPNELILQYWGYGSPKSGAGHVTYAALKRFGLLEDSGAGRARLTQRAQAILLAERQGKRDDARIREAALLPTVHKEIWEKHGTKLPSDENLKYELMTEKGFTPGGASEFIGEWKRTMAYAKLTDSGATVSPDGGETPTGEEQKMTPPATIVAEDHPASQEDPLERNEDDRRETRTVQVTYSPSEWALLQGRFPMSEDDWDAMIAVLTAMKRGLVSKPTD